MTISSEIRELINLKAEGDYWDYKEQWHANKADLLHDIICMANNLVNRDAYIIIGVSDSKSPEGVKVKGVTETNRKDQQHLIDFLRDKKFSGGIRPVVYLETIPYEISCDNAVELDVIIIKNTANTPYFLTEDFRDGKSTVKSGNIYTRIGDTNTAKTGCADLDKIEYLWRKRFGLDLSVSEKLLHLLDNPDDWTGQLDNGNTKYHRLFPEFQIQISDEEDREMQSNSIPKNIAGRFPDKAFSAYDLTITYHTTVIFKRNVICFDGARYMLPFPDSEIISLCGNTYSEESLIYVYLDLDSVQGKLFNCMSCCDNAWYSCKWFLMDGSAFLVFQNSYDRDRFNSFARRNLPRVIEEYKRVLFELEENGIQVDTDLKIGSWSKGNQIKSWHLYEMYRGIKGRSLSDKIKYMSYESIGLKYDISIRD